MIVDPHTFVLPRFPAFIVLDGPNGAGKTTLQRSMVRFFEGHKLSIRATREPGGTKIGETLRAIALGQGNERLNENAELMVFSADRAEHVAKVIRPSLQAGVSVVSDRYYYSTTAFQGFGRGLNRNLIEALNTIAIDGTYPDLAIFLDLPPEVGLRRNAAEKGRESDSFESETLAFHTRLREGFTTIATQVREPCIVLDATQPPEVVFSLVEKLLERSRAASAMSTPG